MASLPASNLLAAQKRLEKRRADLHRRRQALGLPPSTTVHAEHCAPPTPDLPTSLAAIPWQKLPPHLGWGSQRLTGLMRRCQRHRRAWEHASAKEQLVPTEPTVKEVGAVRAALALAPDIALAILRAKLAAPGRIWYLLRALDHSGRGWLSLATVRQALTSQRSTYAVCGRRQLRNLLKAGAGTFWQISAERLWLRRPARVAASLGLTRVVHRPVEFPIKALLGPLKGVKARLYATLHSARTPNESKRHTAPQSAPLARQTIENLTGLSRQTQRQYEKEARVTTRRQFAIGPNPSPELSQELAWQRGNSLFTYRDRRGQFGQPDQNYLAWQLPNRYQGPHERLSRQRRRRLQRDLTDLLTKGTTGNGKMGAEITPAVYEPGRRYWASARAAISPCAEPLGKHQPPHRASGQASALALEPRDGQLRYWPAQKSGYWFVLLGVEVD